ncbi:iron-sulfur cluster assembly protein [Palaeococcus ferrophilus]|uniref:iron-sulfur cluster assembly protein n=1 Tax=Palaeococcus ferrophilus TaxID=83868 RepID=UPI00064F76F4|nr:iron-sulfur cluster assembly protein [Palaeococcus ferrophilus]
MENKIIALLRKVKEPIAEMDIVSLGIVSKVMVDDETGKVTVYLDLAHRTPHHPFEMALNWAVHARIVKDVVNVLGEKFPNLEILDSMTLQRYYPIEEDEL